MEWLQDNATFVSAMATLFMAVIWLIYAHIGIVSIMRSRKPRIMIDQTEESTFNTRFLILNLSQQPVYVSCVLIVINQGEESSMYKISSFTRVASATNLEGDVPEAPEPALRHGALSPGDFLMVGDSHNTLRWLLGYAVENVEDESAILDNVQAMLAEIDSFEMRVISVVGVEDHPVASCRRFNIIKTDEGELSIRPSDQYTNHLGSRRDRGTVAEWNDFCLNN